MPIQTNHFPETTKDSWSSLVGRLFNILERTQDVIFPAYCQLCDCQVQWPQIGGICSDCIRQIPSIRTACSRCGASIPVEVVPSYPYAKDFISPERGRSTDVKGCINCRTGKWPSRRIYAFGTYSGTLAKILVQLKRPGSESSAISLGNAIGDWFLSQSAPLFPVKYDAIVPTPKYWIRRVSQRHNSAELLAESIGKKLDIPVWPDGIVQLRPTSKQGVLLANQRRQNVQDAFATNSRRSWAGKCILVIDDIVTSGSTMAEIANVLKRSGVLSVDALCAARGVGARDQGNSKKNY